MTRRLTTAPCASTGPPGATRHRRHSPARTPSGANRGSSYQYAIPCCQETWWFLRALPRVAASLAHDRPLLFPEATPDADLGVGESPLQAPVVRGARPAELPDDLRRFRFVEQVVPAGFRARLIHQKKVTRPRNKYRSLVFTRNKVRRPFGSSAHCANTGRVFRVYVFAFCAKTLFPRVLFHARCRAGCCPKGHHFTRPGRRRLTVTPYSFLCRGAG